MSHIAKYGSQDAVSFRNTLVNRGIELRESRRTNPHNVTFCMKPTLCYASFLLFSFPLFLFLSFRTWIPAKPSELQKLRDIVRNVVPVWHCVWTQQIHISLCFRGWRRPRFLSTFLSSFSRGTPTTASASTPAFPWFSCFARFVSCRLTKSQILHVLCNNGIGKVNKTAGKPLKYRKAI